MVSLTDAQMSQIMTAASPLPTDKRDAFLRRLAARLDLIGRRFTDDDLVEATRSALAGLIQSTA